MNSDKTATILIDLGLTPNQAKILITLTQLKESPIQAISDYSGIPRESVYRSMPALEKIGLVEKVIANPTRYVAAGLEDAICLLMKRRTQKTLNLEQQIARLTQKLAEDKVAKPLDYEEPKFILLSGLDAYLRQIHKSITDAQQTVDIMATEETLRKYMFYWLNTIKKALRRGIQFRCLVIKTRKLEIDLGDEVLKKEPLWKVRCIQYRQNLSEGVAVFDSKEAVMGITPSQTNKNNYLRSTSPCVRALVQHFFETVWSEAEPKKEVDL